MIRLLPATTLISLTSYVAGHLDSSTKTNNMTSTISSWCNLTNETVLFVTVHVLVVQGIFPKQKRQKRTTADIPLYFWEI